MVLRFRWVNTVFDRHHCHSRWYSRVGTLALWYSRALVLGRVVVPFWYFLRFKAAAPKNMAHPLSNAYKRLLEQMRVGLGVIKYSHENCNTHRVYTAPFGYTPSRVPFNQC